MPRSCGSGEALDDVPEGCGRPPRSQVALWHLGQVLDVITRHTLARFLDENGGFFKYLAVPSMPKYWAGPANGREDQSPHRGRGGLQQNIIQCV